MDEPMTSALLAGLAAAMAMEEASDRQSRVIERSFGPVDAYGPLPENTYRSRRQGSFTGRPRAEIRAERKARKAMRKRSRR